MKSLFALVTAAAIAVLPAHADSNLVANGSFEDAPNGTPTTGSPTTTSYTASGSFDYVKTVSSTPPYTAGVNTTLITDWTVTGIPQGGSYGLVNKNIFNPSEATTGDQQALIMQDYFNGPGGTIVSNSLGTILPNSTYTLSLDIGAPPTLTGLTTNKFNASEMAPQVIFSLLGNGSNVIKTDTLQNTSVSLGTLTNYTLTFTTGASGGFVGQTLSLKLQANKELYSGNADPGAEAAIFDDVVVTVPEPSSYALMGVGALMILFAGRKLRRA